MFLPTNIIYGLVDPRLGYPRYVGQSSVGLKRPEEHKWRAPSTDRTHRANWLRSLRRDGVGYFTVVLQDLPDDANVDALDAAEIKWIAFGNAQGWDLTNTTAGGGGVRGLVHTDETKVRISEKSREGWSDPQRRVVHADRQRGRVRDENTRKKIGAALRGKRRPPHVVEALRVANSGRVRAQSVEERAARSDVMKGNSRGTGYRHTPEARARIAAARKGKPTHGKNYRKKDE